MITVNETTYTAMWQEMPRYPHYRIQTNDAAVARKLARRKAATLVGFSLNVVLWIYRLQYSSPRVAVKSLRRLSGTSYRKIEKDTLTGGFISYTRNKLNSR